MPKYVEVTEDEAWAIDHTIRHTFNEGTNNVGRDLLLKVMTVVLEFEERRGSRLSPQVLPVALTEDECWAIDHQIRCDLTVNGKPVGRAILLKVFRALTEYANERDSDPGWRGWAPWPTSSAPGREDRGTAGRGARGPPGGRGLGRPPGAGRAGAQPPGPAPAG